MISEEKGWGGGCLKTPNERCTRWAAGQGQPKNVRRLGQPEHEAAGPAPPATLAPVAPQATSTAAARWSSLLWSLTVAPHAVLLCWSPLAVPMLRYSSSPCPFY